MADYDFHHLHHVKVQLKTKKTLWMIMGFTIFFTVVEIIGGILSNSLALLSDSAHMISDVVALGLSMLALYLATRPPNARFTFGYLRFEIIASFLNGLALIVIAIGIFIEGVRRVIYPEMVDYQLMLLISSIGLVVNLITTLVLKKTMEKENNLSLKSALWHFFGDLLSSIGVIIAAILVYVTGSLLFDPLISMVIGGIICTGGFKIIRESYLILMESVPEEYDLDEIRLAIAGVEGVEDVHEMHLWTISSNHYSLTAHVFIHDDIQPFCIILAINDVLKHKFNIEHSTIQMENAIIHPHGEYGKEFMKNKNEDV